MTQRAAAREPRRRLVVLELLGGQEASGRTVRVDLGLVPAPAPRPSRPTFRRALPVAALVGLDIAQTIEGQRPRGTPGRRGRHSASARRTAHHHPGAAPPPRRRAGASPHHRLDGVHGRRRAARRPATPQCRRHAVRSTSSTSGGHGVLRLPQPTDGEPIPVAAGPGVAAAAGPEPARSRCSSAATASTRALVASLERFPTGGALAVVLADVDRLNTAIEAAAPGQGRPIEVWVGRAGPRRAVDRALALAALRRRSTRGPTRPSSAPLVDDPLARGILIVLAGTAAAGPGPRRRRARGGRARRPARRPRGALRPRGPRPAARHACAGACSCAPACSPRSRCRSASRWARSAPSWSTSCASRPTPARPSHRS